MNANRILFDILALIVLGSAFLVATGKNLVRSVFLFFVTLFALAGLYVFALADFVAITQIVIYVGGVLVLMLFAFMLTNKADLNNLKQIGSTFVAVKKMPALLLVTALLFLLLNAIVKAQPDQQTWVQNAVQQGNTIQATDSMISNIGINLMTRYLLPFEAVSILLMMALIGAAHLARKEEHTL